MSFNFEHARHVVMSASKLLKRIIFPHDVEYIADETGHKLKNRMVICTTIHETTSGISSNPLMQFAAIFAAIVDDVDHWGITDKQLQSTTRTRWPW